MSHEARPREDNLTLRTRKVLVTKSGFVQIVYAPTVPDPLNLRGTSAHFPTLSLPAGTEYFTLVTFLLVWFCLLLRDPLITASQLRCMRIFFFFPGKSEEIPSSGQLASS